MKVIDLLNKIANGEEVPKRIEYDGIEFKFIEGAYEDEKGNDLCYYDNSCRFFLNDEVEIIEEKKKIPEKLDEYADVSGGLACEWTFGEKKLKEKINEIIDYLKSKGE